MGLFYMSHYLIFDWLYERIYVVLEQWSKMYVRGKLDLDSDCWRILSRSIDTGINSDAKNKDS